MASRDITMNVASPKVAHAARSRPSRSARTGAGAGCVVPTVRATRRNVSTSALGIALTSTATRSSRVLRGLDTRRRSRSHHGQTAPVRPGMSSHRSARGGPLHRLSLWPSPSFDSGWTTVTGEGGIEGRSPQEQLQTALVHAEPSSAPKKRESSAACAAAGDCRRTARGSRGVKR
jgi:hypothetical protein